MPINLPTKERLMELVRQADEIIGSDEFRMGQARMMRMNEMLHANQTNMLGGQGLVGQGMTGTTTGQYNTVVGYLSGIASKFQPEEEYPYLISTLPEPKHHEPSEIQKNKVHETTVSIKTRKINHIIEDVHYT